MTKEIKAMYTVCHSVSNTCHTGSIPFTRGRGPFVICDYGTADGGNAVILMTNCFNYIDIRTFQL